MGKSHALPASSGSICVDITIVVVVLRRQDDVGVHPPGCFEFLGFDFLLDRAQHSNHPPHVASVHAHVYVWLQLRACRRFDTE